PMVPAAEAAGHPLASVDAVHVVPAHIAAGWAGSQEAPAGALTHQALFSAIRAGACAVWAGLDQSAPRRGDGRRVAHACHLLLLPSSMSMRGRADRYAPASCSTSRSATRGEGRSSGFGGCNTASRWAVGRPGHASPSGSASGSSDGTL